MAKYNMQALQFSECRFWYRITEDSEQ